MQLARCILAAILMVPVCPKSGFLGHAAWLRPTRRQVMRCWWC